MFFVKNSLSGKDNSHQKIIASFFAQKLYGPFFLDSCGAENQAALNPGSGPLTPIYLQDY